MQKGVIIQVEAISPINIALVKYWGKANEKEIIPTNNSLSITVNKQDLCSKTRITLLSDADFDVRLVLNAKEEPVTSRIKNVIRSI